LARTPATECYHASPNSATGSLARGAVGRVRVMDAATDDRSARVDGTRAAGVGVGGNELREAVEDYAC
jgi:hypothetical protein